MPSTGSLQRPRSFNLCTKLLTKAAFADLDEARLEVAYYLDTYFNLDRRHSALGYRSPHQFEADLANRLP
ncbi:hypothetical protein GCM10027048_32360 [Hymenobacter coalescens]